MNEFDKVGLYDHNAESYRKVRESFKENNVVGIVHATGTGKSYNALQLAYDNKDLKTIWAVPKNAIKEHIIKSIEDNPNLDMERDFPNLEFKSYSALTKDLVDLNMDEIADLDIDLLILDEFHHTGAPVWGRIINSIIDTHPDIKVFGMTAYTVRDRGTSYERDMALDNGDELFSDNIVSRYDICDAMIDGVLPKPVYKSSYIKLIDMSSKLEERVKKLEASGRECSEYNKILNDVKKRIHEAPGLGEVVKQNIKKNGKYIYFCPPAGEEGTNDIETIKKEAISWFKEIVPEEDIVIYTSLSEMEDGGKSNREAFYDDLDLEGNKVDNKLRVMFAINQYNEGVHAPNLDGVIMGRGTCSDIVFFEQLGRALSVSSGVKEKIELYSTYSIERLRLMCLEKNINYNYDMDRNTLIEKLVAPVIIDLAGNIDFIKELEDNLKDRIKEYQEKGDGTLTRGFLSDASFDLDMYELDLFNIVKVLRDKIDITWDDWYKLAEEYYNEYGNLMVPHSFITINGEKLGYWINRQRQVYKNGKLLNEKISKLESIGMIWDVKEANWYFFYEYARKYFKKYGNLEISDNFRTNDGITYEEHGKVYLGKWISSQRSNCNPESKRGKLLSEIGMRFEKKTNMLKWEEWYKYAKKYYEKHKNLEVPRYFITDDGFTYNDHGLIKLGNWITDQRRKISPVSERGKKLSEIGMRFEKKVNRLKWEEWYEYAKNYYDYYHNLNIHQHFKTNDGIIYDKNGSINLGTWISDQRKAYKNGKLSDEQISKLESIGMIWNAKKNKSDIENLCKENNINIKKNKNIIDHISLTEFKVKLSYLKDNGMNIVDENGMLHEIFSMSSMNMKLKYGVSLEDLVNMYGKEKNK